MKQQSKIAELLKRIETSKQQDVELGTYEIYLFSESELEKDKSVTDTINIKFINK